jgi:hypothetical protein
MKEHFQEQSAEIDTILMLNCSIFVAHQSSDGLASEAE